MSTDELRQAAETLRTEFSHEDVESIDEAHLFLALADWLDAQADVGGIRFTTPGVRAYAVARLINGGAS